jgi:uncharacterized membrane protein/protein-disulfide isomerase
MSPLARRLVWGLALIGLVASLTSLYVHYRLLTTPGYSSFCDVSATVSCTQAYLSRYGSYKGVPVALLGAIWFASTLLLAWLEVAGPPALRETAPGYLFLSSTVALAIILYLAYAAFFVLKVVCFLCLATYAAVIGLFIVSGLASTIPMTRVLRRIPGDLRALVARPAALAAVIVFAAGAASALAFFPSEASLRGQAAQQPAAAAPTPDVRAEFAKWWAAQPRTTVPVSADGAAVVVVKFSDYQCGACASTHFAMKPILAKYQAQYPGAVKFVEKDFPLQPDCNSTVTRAFHLAACDAAAAVRMAQQNGKGGALQDWLYGNQPSISPATVRDMAASVGGVRDFDGGYGLAINGVKADVGLGRLLNVRVTPTFYVNGVKAEDGGQPISPQFIDIAIELELKKAGVIK